MEPKIKQHLNQLLCRVVLGLQHTCRSTRRTTCIRPLGSIAAVVS